VNTFGKILTKQMADKGGRRVQWRKKLGPEEHEGSVFLYL
jgi:hypothetical protein